MANSRVARGRESEQLVAEQFRAAGWPDAQRVPASIPGKDIIGIGDISCEVKARRSLDLTGWLKQAASRPGLPLLVVRPDGYGGCRLDQWPAVFRLADAVQLLARRRDILTALEEVARISQEYPGTGL